MATETLSSTKVAGGTLRRVKHASAATNTDMVFALFTPAARGVETTNEAIHILESGECLRCVVIY